MAANPEYTINPLFSLPSAANNTSLTPAAVAWTNSAYAQVTASAPSDLYIAGVIVNPGVATDFECDVASGAAASETVLGTLCGSVKSNIGGPMYIPFPILSNFVSSGTRIAIRHRQLSTTTTAWGYALVYYASPMQGNVTTTSNASKVLPSAAAMTSITGASSTWANSAWAQITATTASALVIGGICFSPGVASVEQEVDLGTGAAGSETVITTVRVNMRTATGGPWVYMFENPLDNIASSVRVAARTRVNSISSTASKIKLIYYSKPL